MTHFRINILPAYQRANIRKFVEVGRDGSLAGLSGITTLSMAKIYECADPLRYYLRLADWDYDEVVQLKTSWISALACSEYVWAVVSLRSLAHQTPLLLCFAIYFHQYEFMLLNQHSHVKTEKGRMGCVVHQGAAFAGRNGQSLFATLELENHTDVG